MHILVQLVKQVLLSFLTLFVKSNRSTITLFCIRLSETLAVSERCMAKTPLYMAPLFLPNTDDRYALFFLDQDVCGFQKSRAIQRQSVSTDIKRSFVTVHLASLKISAPVTASAFE